MILLQGAFSESDPSRIGDKHEFMIKSVLECVERDDVLLNRAVEACGTALIQTLPLERVKQLLFPLISKDNPRVVIIAGALKLFSHMIATLSRDEAYNLLQETKTTVQEVWFSFFFDLRKCLFSPTITQKLLFAGLRFSILFH